MLDRYIETGKPGRSAAPAKYYSYITSVFGGYLECRHVEETVG